MDHNYGKAGLEKLTHSKVVEFIADWQERGNYESRDRVIESYLELAEKVTTRLAKRSRDSREDLLSEAVMGLMGAIDRFDVKRGNFSSYAWTCMRGHVLNKMNSRFNKNVSQSLNQSIFSDGDGERIDRVSTEVTALDGILDSELREDLVQALSVLSDRDRAIVGMYFGIGSQSKTYQEIADEFGISKMGAQKIVQRALKALRGELS